MIRTALAAFLMLALPVHAFDLQGHRGARGLAPENTLRSFAKALEIGVDTLECDMAITGGVNVMLRPEYPITMSKGIEIEPCTAAMIKGTNENA